MVHDRLKRGQAAAWARALGISHAALYNVISGKRKPSEDLADRLVACSPIPVTRDELLTQMAIGDLI